MERARATPCFRWRGASMCTRQPSPKWTIGAFRSVRFRHGGSYNERMRSTIAAFLVLALTACSGGSGSGDPTPTATPTPTPTATPTPVAPLRFIALGDTGKANEGQTNVAAAMADQCAAEGCDFVILLGDNFYDNGVSSTSDTLWTTMFVDPYAAVDVPFYAVLGNHDYGGNGAGNDFPKGQHQIDYSAVNPKWRMPDNRYSFTAGPATFLALDTNKIMYGILEDQPAFAASVLSSASTPWILAVGHHPYISNGPHGNAGTYEGIPNVPVTSGANVKAFFDDSICGNVDAYLCGHDHSRQLLDGPVGCPMLNVVSGAGASATTLQPNNASLFESTELGFAYVVVTGTSLTISMIGTDGGVDFTLTRTK